MNKLSIIIPTYHRNDDLALCLERLGPGKQTLSSEHYEVIVTDDGRDSTAQTMIAEKFPWARWTQGPQRGPAANRNHGATRANEEWLVFTDDDCLPSSGWLEAYFTRLNKEVVLEGLTRADREQCSFAEESPINLTGGYLWSCNFAILKRVFFELVGFDEEFPAAAMEDCDFRERLRKAGYSFPFVAEAEVIHIWRPAKGWRFRSQYLKALIYYNKKHPDLAPQCLAQELFLNGVRYGKNTIFKNVIRFRFRGISHAVAACIWHFWAALGLFWGD